MQQSELGALKNEANAREFAAAVERRVDTRGDAFSMTVEGERFGVGGEGGRAEAAAAYRERLLRVRGAYGRADEWTTVGAIGGFTVQAQSYWSTARRETAVEVRLDGIPGVVAQVFLDDLRPENTSTGIVVRLENALAALEARQVDAEERAERLRIEVDRMQARIGKPYARSAEVVALRAKSERLALKMKRDQDRADLREKIDEMRARGEDISGQTSPEVAIPFDDAIDTDKYDSPLLRGAAAPDEPPAPDVAPTIEAPEIRSAWEPEEPPPPPPPPPRPAPEPAAPAEPETVGPPFANVEAVRWHWRNGIPTEEDLTEGHREQMRERADGPLYLSDGRSLVIHKVGGAWSITHAASGLKLYGNRDTKKEAVALADRVEAALRDRGFDWDAPGIQGRLRAPLPDGEDARDVIGQAKRNHEYGLPATPPPPAPERPVEEVEEPGPPEPVGVPEPAPQPAPEPAPTPTEPTAPDVGWGSVFGGDEPSYQTPDGPVWMFRRGQRVRFYDQDGGQVGPEQANVAPAVAYAQSQG